MSRKGTYHGGGTVIGPRNVSWFKKDSIKALPKASAPKAPLTKAEQIEYDALVRQKLGPSVLIKAGTLAKKRGKVQRRKHPTRSK